MHTLSLAQNNLKDLPDWLFQLTKQSLHRLDLSQNQNLLKLNQNICQLENLRILLFHSCPIIEIPS